MTAHSSPDRPPGPLSEPPDRTNPWTLKALYELLGVELDRLARPGERWDDLLLLAARGAQWTMDTATWQNIRDLLYAESLAWPQSPPQAPSKADRLFALPIRIDDAVTQPHLEIR